MFCATAGFVPAVVQEHDEVAALGDADEERGEAVDAARVLDEGGLLAAEPDLPHAPAVAVVLQPRRVHQLAAFGREHLVRVERLIPEVEVFDRGVHRAGRVGQRHVEVGRVVVARGRPGVAGGALREQRGVAVVAGVLHAEGVEDALLQDLVVGLARHLLDDGAEEEVAGVVVVELRARLEFEVVAGELLDEVGDGVRVAALLGEEGGPPRVAGDAGGVVEELVDGDAPARVLAVVGQVVRELAVELDLACSTSWRMRAEVNCLVMEPSRNFVSGSTGTAHSMLAIP